MREPDVFKQGFIEIFSDLRQFMLLGEYENYGTFIYGKGQVMFFLYNQNGIEVEFQVYKKFNDVYNHRSAIALESGEKVDIFENF